MLETPKARPRPTTTPSGHTASTARRAVRVSRLQEVRQIVFQASLPAENPGVPVSSGMSGFAVVWERPLDA